MTAEIDSITTAILEIAQELELPINRASILANADLREIGLDSIDQTSLLVAIERRFQRKILGRVKKGEIRLLDLVNIVSSACRSAP